MTAKARSVGRRSTGGRHAGRPNRATAACQRGRDAAAGQAGPHGAVASTLFPPRRRGRQRRWARSCWAPRSRHARPSRADRHLSPCPPLLPRFFPSPPPTGAVRPWRLRTHGGPGRARARQRRRTTARRRGRLPHPRAAAHTHWSGGGRPGLVAKAKPWTGEAGVFGPLPSSAPFYAPVMPLPKDMLMRARVRARACARTATLNGQDGLGERARPPLPAARGGAHVPAVYCPPATVRRTRLPSAEPVLIRHRSYGEVGVSRVAAGFLPPAPPPPPTRRPPRHPSPFLFSSRHHCAAVVSLDEVSVWWGASGHHEIGRVHLSLCEWSYEPPSDPPRTLLRTAVTPNPPLL